VIPTQNTLTHSLTYLLTYLLIVHGFSSASALREPIHEMQTNTDFDVYA